MKPLDDESRRLIEEAHAADAPPPASEAAIWRALSEKLHQPLPPTAAAASAALKAKVGVFAGTTTKLQLLGVTALALSSVGLMVYVGARPAPERAASRHEPTNYEEERAMQRDAERAETSSATPSATAPQPAPDSTLREEAQLLAGAQRALSMGDAQRALGLIEQHGVRFTAGALAQERDAARVFALCALGRAAEAQRAARHFLRVWPDSPLGARLRAGCAKPR